MGREKEGAGALASVAAIAVILWCVPARLPAAAAEALREWEPVTLLRKPQGNLTMSARWDPDRGVRLVVEERASGKCVLVEASATGFDVRRLGPGWGAGASFSAPHAYPENAPQRPLGTVAVLLKFRHSDWSLYVENRLLGRVSAPFAPPAVVYRERARKGPGRAAVRFQPVAEENLACDFMVEEGAPNPLYPWQIRTGEWRIHTVQETAVEQAGTNLARVKQVPPTPERSPNFYSLKGKGRDGLIVAGHPFYDDYKVSAAIHAASGEAGIVFYATSDQDYYALSLRQARVAADGFILRLWRLRDGKEQNLARRQVQMPLGQWCRLEAEATSAGRIRCRLDGVQVIERWEPLPAGGRIGLFCRSDDDIRFDDVRLQELSTLALDNVGQIRYRCLRQDGRFFRNGGTWRRPTPAEQQELRPDVASKPQRLLLGCEHHRNLSFQAEFDVEPAAYQVGLIAGYRGEAEPYYCFRVHGRGQAETYSIVLVQPSRMERTLEVWQRLRDPEAAEQPLTLQADATEPGVLRCYRNGRLVLVHHAPSPVVGAAGLYLGPGTRTTVGKLAYRLRADTRFREQQQPNPVFRTDDFMRHWAAPEGQWIGTESDGFWHKGDFFGDFRIEMPWVVGGILHVGALDESPESPVSLKLGDGELVLSMAAQHGAAPATVTARLPAAAAAPAGEEEAAERRLALHSEGWWLWVRVGDAVLAKTRLPGPLPGTRVRAQSYTLEHLSRTRVTRRNVISEFFREAPSAWRMHGGSWQIINRFQCLPSWSHMIGESAEGLAALWYKRRFKGNLTLEFYAGIRHGWYQRPGDLNCTIMAPEQSTGSGYTVTCTEWDFNESQKWSTLHRNGQAVQRADDYLVPRSRKGHVRKYHNPLISAGRPIHGAWYYIKFRRLGNRVEYYFDNERIFALDDPDPLTLGQLALWTFRNSMTLAQVKITFEDSEPVTYPVRKLPPNETTPPGPLPAQGQPEPPPTALQNHGFPMQPLQIRYWEVDDPVGGGLLEPIRFNAPALKVVNRFGAGSLFATARLPHMALDRTAGWQFEIKRTAGAALNFHYSIGTVDGNGNYRPAQYFFHQISGTDFSDGTCIRTGNTNVAPVAELDRAASGWTTVNVGIPSSQRPVWGSKQARQVRIEGFGNRQHTYLCAGVNGARPGDGYVVRQLHPVLYEPPDLVRPPSAAEIAGLKLRKGSGARILGRYQDLAALQAELVRRSRPGLNRAWIRVQTVTGTSFAHHLSWVQLPPNVPLHCRWDSARADTVILEVAAPFVDPRFAAAAVTVDGESLPLLTAMREVRYARVPRLPESPWLQDRTLEFHVYSGTETTVQRLPRRGRRVNAGPFLLGLDGLTPLCETFEPGNGSDRIQPTADGRVTFHVNEPAAATSLQIRNRAYGQRLRARIRTGFSVARYPLMALRYRALDMTYISAAFGPQHVVRLGDDSNAARTVRLGQDWVQDRQWHDWLGVVADAFHTDTYDPAKFQVATLDFGSKGSLDQTGHLSKCFLDDLVFGPAVRRADELVCTPRYFDLDGVARVEHAVAAGSTCFGDRTAAEQSSLVWAETRPGEALRPRIDGLDDGIHHLLLKAVDEAGREAAVTDIPFMLDTKPLEPAVAFEPMPDPAGNGVRMRIAFANHGGAPWQIDTAAFLLCGRPEKLPVWSNRFQHTTSADTLFLNYPFILRRDLDAAEDGDVLEFAVEHVSDGAGNESPKLVVPVPVKHEGDNTGPAWFMVDFGSQVRWFHNWDGHQNGALALTPAAHNQTGVRHEAGQSPFLYTGAYQNSGSLHRNLEWRPATHPWISFRMCLPGYVPARRPNLELVFVTTANQTFTLSLMQPQKGSTALNQTREFAWQAGQWKRCSFNVLKLLDGLGMAKEQQQHLVVKQIALRRSGTSHNQQLYLDDLFLHGAGAETTNADTISWDAFDASGVSALHLACVKDDDSTAWEDIRTERNVDLGPLRARTGEGNWIRCRAEDKAGNLSVPFWIPFPPAATDTEADPKP